ncbi:MAG: KUP/HAK/KT family potassium transporter, partial [Myxococcales bacterium]|nr:KUP/HAK/KT family potassium transporter [Myxococcales bacterium]MDH5567036.1 KUP/HAK/KT family potassium transporter [Myxococcales bacterium]
MAEAATPSVPEGRRLLSLCLSASGIVYGDIGTSPIYAIRECFHVFHGVEPSPAAVLGVLSLIFWSLVLVISIKYLFLVMRADNHGEGGIIALTALVSLPSRPVRGAGRLLILAGLFGAALLYGDSMITPAISVLSAVEGLRVATPVVEPFVLPITVLILLGLFGVQSHGTARVGAVFGPIMLLWFLTLAALGAREVIQHPGVLVALDPRQAVRFFAEHRAGAFLVLGAVFLVVTGGEALYADMGHFGRRPIRLTWFGLVLPALLINYFGQGALIIQHPAAVAQPFFLLAPSWALYPLVALTTAATVIASQAVISGAFSLTRQAVLLGYLPRLRIEHTSARQIGQVYLPAVNRLLMVCCIGLVVAFGSSSNLAGAYGMAVTTDMVFTTILFGVVAWRAWGWNPVLLLLLLSGLLCVDLAFWTANLPKIPHGGWFPLLVAAAVFTAMTTWKTGRDLLTLRMKNRAVPIELFVADIRAHAPIRVPGTAVYMDSHPHGTPPALLHNLKHNHVLHERVVFLTIQVEEIPSVPEVRRFEVSDLGEGMHRLRVHVGFTEDVDVPALLARCPIQDVSFDPMRTSYFLGRERVIATGTRDMGRW